MDQVMWQKVSKRIDTYKDWATKLSCDLIPIKAIAPDSGGEGEVKKAQYLKAALNPLVDKLTYYNAPDGRVPDGFRPNIVATKKGKNSGKRLFILAHMDVVPEGDLSKWNTDPWKGVVKDGKIYGRGAADNNQAIISMFALLKALKEEKITPSYDIVAFLLADEECGNKYGIRFLADEHKELFQPGDTAIIGDAGNPQGSFIEIAEKGVCWMKVTIEGKQAHGSMPTEGINPHYASAEFATRMEALYKKFDEKNKLFDVPTSTFEITKKEANIPNINTIPGTDVTYYDCRLLPSLHRDDVFLKEVHLIKTDIEKKRGVKFAFEYPYVIDSSSTSPDSLIAKLIISATKEVNGVDANPVGIGGGTFAGKLRHIGVDSVVFSKTDESLFHMVNEYCEVNNILADAKVMAHILASL